MQNIKRQIVLISITLFALIMQSCGTQTKKKSELKANLNVKVETIKSVNQARIFSYAGKIEAKQHSVLSTRIMGNVIAINVVPGQKVRKGDVLLKISDNDILSKKAQIKAAQMEAEAIFLNAEKDYNRFKVLFEQKSASQKELDDVSTNFKMAKARLNTANEMENELNETLKYSTIRAPYNGVITKKYINNGDLASPGMSLLGIEQSNELNVIARIPESEISCVEIGDMVEVQVNAANSIRVKGEVIEVNLSALLTGSQYEVKIKLLPELEQKVLLRSGMYTKVLLEKGGIPTIMVPEKAILYRGQLCGIYTISQSNTAMLRWIRLGKQSGNNVEVLSGLAEGERYIKSYSGKIWDGVIVNIIK
jgi:RND family efflux transporter MFP subunit